MVSPSLDPSASAAAPRHARDDDATAARGRHRRPESLADSRATPFVPARTSMASGPGHPAPAGIHGGGTRHVPDHHFPAPAASLAATSVAAEAHPADEAIREARHAASRLSRGRDEAAPKTPGRRRAENRPRADSRQTGRRHAGNTTERRHADGPAEPRHAGHPTGRRPAGDPIERRHAARRPAAEHADRVSAERRPLHRHRHRPATPRGRHAMSPDPMSITVRPLRSPGDVRAWEPATAARPPVIGSRRAPGTLPIESWLLVGKARQQALLAAVVAAGLALVMIPAAQRANDPVNPVNAAGNAAVVAEPAREPAAKPPAANGRAVQRDRPAATETTEPAARPSGSAPAAATSPSASAESDPAEIEVPPGDGPFRTLRTTGTSTVALTFDDGPDPVQTPRILAMLDEHGVTATFCLVGSQVAKHPEIVRQIVAAGHTLCNHTWDHNLTIGRDSPAVIEADLARTDQAIHDAVPGVAVPFFRAPGGNFTDRLVRTAYRAGMTSLYWEVDPRDWERAKGADDAAHVARIVDEVRRSVQPGAIVLSHDFNQPQTIDAYAQLLPWLNANFALGVPAVPERPADR